MSFDRAAAFVMSKLAEVLARREGFYVAGSIPQVRNNPIDLRHSPHSTHPADDPDGIGYIDTIEHGWADAERQLMLYASRGLTVEQMIAEFAPPTDGNDTSEYLQFVCANLPCEPSTLVSDALQVGLQRGIMNKPKSQAILASGGAGGYISVLIIAALEHWGHLVMSSDVKTAITMLCIAAVSYFFHQ